MNHSKKKSRRKCILLEILIRKFQPSQDILFSTSRNSENHSTQRQGDYSPVHADLARTTKSTILDFVFLAMGHRSALTYTGLRTLFHRTVDTFRLHRHFLPLSLSLFLIARSLATSSGPLTTYHLHFLFFIFRF